MNYFEGNQSEEKDLNIESLRRILECQQSRAITYEEAFEVGESLLTFYTILAEEEAEESVEARS